MPDVRQDSRYVEIRPSTRSEVCVPFHMHGQVLGVINAESDRLGAFTQDDVELLMTLTNVVVFKLKDLMKREAIVEQLLQKLRSLSEREREVLRWLVEGKGNKEIAKTLNLSERTVEGYLTHIYAKLGVRSRAEATALLREHPELLNELKR